MKDIKNSFLKSRKEQIDQYIINLINDQKISYNQHQEANILFDHLENFINSGKTIRGSLFLEFLAHFGKDEEELKQYLPLAAAMEIIHSALLIQDDYMDQDDQRRGLDSFHKVNESIAENQKIRKPVLYSISSMICATDICFFIAYGEIAKVSIPQIKTLISYITQEYAHVGFAQWKDVKHGLSPFPSKKTDLEKVYLYKTARYTFVLPIICAAIICEIDKKQISNLEKAGESLGMIFQITDDYLNIFGDPEKTGKPLGSDIIQDKETYYKYLINKNLKSHHINEFFGKKEISHKEIELIKKTIKNHHIDKEIDKIINGYKNKFTTNLNKLKNSEIRVMMNDLFEYIVGRQK